MENPDLMPIQTDLQDFLSDLANQIVSFGFSHSPVGERLQKRKSSLAGRQERNEESWPKLRALVLPAIVKLFVMGRYWARKLVA